MKVHISREAYLITVTGPSGSCTADVSELRIKNDEQLRAWRENVIDLCGASLSDEDLWEAIESLGKVWSND